MNLSARALQPEIPLPTPDSGHSPPWLRFGLICTLLLLAAILLEPWLGPLCRATAAQVAAFLDWLGYHPLRHHDKITLNGFAVRIVVECTPLYAGLMYAAFVLAQPAAVLRTVLGLAAGLGVITVVNVARIALLTAAGSQVSALVFDLLHVYFGQVVMVLLVVALAQIWREWGTRERLAFPFALRAGLYGSLLFFPWAVVNRAYLALLDSVVALLFRLVFPDSYLLTPCPLSLYNHTFAIPLFLALFLAASLPWTVNRFAAIVAGCYAIAGWHLLFRVTHVLMTAFDMPEIAPLHQGVYLLGQFMIPILLGMRLKRS